MLFIRGSYLVVMRTEMHMQASNLGYRRGKPQNGPAVVSVLDRFSAAGAAQARLAAADNGHRCDVSGSVALDTANQDGREFPEKSPSFCFNFRSDCSAP